MEDDVGDLNTIAMTCQSFVEQSGIVADLLRAKIIWSQWTAAIASQKVAPFITEWLKGGISRVCEESSSVGLTDELGPVMQQIHSNMKDYLYLRASPPSIGQMLGDKTLISSDDSATMQITEGKRQIERTVSDEPMQCVTCGPRHNPYEEPMTCPVMCAHNSKCQHYALSEDGIRPYYVGREAACYRCALKVPLISRGAKEVSEDCKSRFKDAAPTRCLRRFYNRCMKIARRISQCD